MEPETQPYTFDRVFRLALAAGIIWGLVWVLGYLSDVLIPFAVALLLAYLMNPLVDLVQRVVKSRVAAVLASLVLIALALALALYLVIPLIVSEIGQMATIAEELTRNSKLAQRLAQWLPDDLWQALKEFAAQPKVKALLSTKDFWKLVQDAAATILPGAWSLVTSLGSLILGFLGLFVILLYLVFLLIDFHQVQSNWHQYLPGGSRQAVMGLLEDFDFYMSRYFRAQSAVASLVGVLSAFGFWLIDLPMGVVLGLLVGLLNMVPYLQNLALPPAFLLALIHALDTGMDPWAMLGLTTLVFVVVQVIQDGFLVPKIMGSATGLNPALILLSLSIWGKLLGIFGLLIAIPVSCLILAYYRHFLVSGKVEPSRTDPELGGE